MIAEIRKGQRFRTRVDTEVNYLTHWMAPFTGGGKGILPAGTILTVTLDPPPGVKGAGCDPENREAIEAILIPEAERSAPKYGGFTIVVAQDWLRNQCDAVEQGVERDGR